MSGMNGAPAIEVEALTKEYDGGVRALDGIDFAVPPGQIFSYLGRNGSGKTTTVRILTTLSRPTSGRARVLGHSVTDEPDEVRRRIGATMQEVALDQVMTGREHLELACGLWGLPKQARRSRTAELLEFFGLADAADRAIGEYSGGMRRRLDVATALISEPRVLFLDEPTTGLDPQSRRTLWGEIERLRDGGTTIFLTTQYLEEAEALANQIAVIEAGQVVSRGTVADLKAMHGHTTVEIRLASAIAAENVRRALPGHEVDAPDGGLSLSVTLPSTGAEAAAASVAIAARLHDEGIELAGLSIREPTLEDVFVELTGSGISGGSGEPEEAGEPAEAAA